MNTEDVTYSPENTISKNHLHHNSNKQIIHHILTATIQARAGPYQTHVHINHNQHCFMNRPKITTIVSTLTRQQAVSIYFCNS